MVLDGSQQVVLDIKLLHPFQSLQTPEGFQAVVVEVQDLHSTPKQMGSAKHQDVLSLTMFDDIASNKPG